MRENPKFIWPTADQSDPSVYARRSRYEETFRAAFAGRPRAWTVRILDEQLTSIYLQFEDAAGKSYDPPLRFSGMCDERDIFDATTFLPWL